MESVLRYKWYIIVGVIGAVILGSSAYFISTSFSRKKPIQNQFAQLNVSPSPEAVEEFETEIASESADLLQTDFTTKAIIAQINDLTQKVKKISTLEGKVKLLESSNAALSERLAKYEGQQAVQPLTATSTTTSTTTTKSPLYIPIAVSGSGATTDWTTLSNAQVTINPADYPGYTNMYLVVNLQVYQGSGTAYARIANPSNGLAVLSSQVSTNNENYTLLTSSGFKLSAGASAYSVQLKTLIDGYPAMIENAWIKVVFN